MKLIQNYPFLTPKNNHYFKLVSYLPSGFLGIVHSDITNTSTTTVSNENYVGARRPGYDWAHNRWKRECPAGQMVVGYNTNQTTIYCQKPIMENNKSLGNDCRTIWFDKGDNQSEPYGDWASGYYKGSVAKDEYIAGMAYYSGDVVALFACKID